MGGLEAMEWCLGWHSPLGSLAWGQGPRGLVQAEARTGKANGNNLVLEGQDWG